MDNVVGERVLHLHLHSHTDLQPSQVRALTALGSDGYIKLNVFTPMAEVCAVAAEFRPSFVFVQIQQPYFEPEAFRDLRVAANNPRLVIANWSGDAAWNNAPNPTALDWAIQLAKSIDLTLWSSQTHVDLFRTCGVTAEYLQIGYDTEFFFEGTDAEWGSAFDVAFLYRTHGESLHLSLGSYNDCKARTDAANALQAAFGSRATVGPTHQMLNDAAEAYRRTHLGVSISMSCTLEKYSSDRLFRAMACTATAVKRFTGCETFGLAHEKNCLLFDSTEELVSLAKHWTAPAQLPRLREIGRAGAALVRERHTWDVRIQELAPLIAAARGRQ